MRTVTTTVRTVTVRTVTTTERMGEVLHLWALAPATVGACCVAADRGRARVPEFAAAALMLLAMADIGTGARVIAPVFWALLLLVGAMALAALRGARRRPVTAERLPHPSGAMTVMTALGLVVMAALMIAMGAHAPSSVGDALGGHGHGGFGAWSGGGGGLGPVAALAMAVAAAYVAASAVAAARSAVRLDRVQYASMATATALMALASAT